MVRVAMDAQPVRVTIGGAAVAVRFGENTDLAVRQAERATVKANTAEAAAAFAESVAGPTYASSAAGLAATTDGQAFAVDNGDGTVTVFLNDSGVAVQQRKLATTVALASETGGAMVGMKRSDIDTPATSVFSIIDRSVPVSAAEFGVAGDGVTDDSTGFAGITTELSGQKREIVIPPGVFIVGDWTPPANCPVVGGGNSKYEAGHSRAVSVLKRLPSAAGIVDLKGADYIEFRNLDFHGNGGLAAGVGDCVIDTVGEATQIQFERCKFSFGHTLVNGNGAGVLGGLRMKDCILSDCRIGVRNFRDALIEVNTVTRFRQAGIQVTPGGQNRILGNFIEWGHDSGLAAHGIAIIGDSAKTTIADNQFDGVSGHDVLITNLGGDIPRHILITGNQHKRGAWATNLAKIDRVPIKVADQAHYVAVTGNIFEQDDTRNDGIVRNRTPLAPARFGNAKYVTCKANEFANCTPAIDVSENAIGDDWAWVPSTTTNEYRLTHTYNAGGNPLLLEPDFMSAANVKLTKGTAGSLAAGEWAFADPAGLGFQYPVLRLAADADPSAGTRLTLAYDLPLVDWQSTEFYSTDEAIDQRYVQIAGNSEVSIRLRTGIAMTRPFSRAGFTLSIAADQEVTGADAMVEFAFLLARFAQTDGAITVREGSKTALETGISSSWLSTAVAEVLQIAITPDIMGAFATLRLKNTSANRVDTVISLRGGM